MPVRTKQVRENNIIKTDDVTYAWPFNSLGELFHIRMKKHSEKLAQIDATTGESYTYESLLQRCIRTAMVLTQKGLKQNDIIGICTHNHVNSCVPFIATQFIGGISNSLHPQLHQADDLAQLLKKVTPKIIFASSDSVKKLELALKKNGMNIEIVVFGESKTHTEFSEFLQPQENEEQFKPATIENIKDTAIIYFSSGTTGFPKGICLSHYSFLCQLFITVLENQENTDIIEESNKDTLSTQLVVGCSFSAMYWLSAGLVIIAGVSGGLCLLIHPVFDPKELWYSIDKYKIVFLFLPPHQVVEMLQFGKPEDVSAKSLTTIGIGGEAFSKRYISELEKTLPNVHFGQTFAQTEVAGGLTSAFNPFNELQLKFRQQKPDSCGVPRRGFWYKIVDTETGDNLGPNKIGELRVKTDVAMNGYHNLNSSDCYDEEGYLKTGDLLYYDEDHCFFAVDRIKEIIKYKGWHVLPAILEKELSQHPSILQAVVIGQPNEEDGEHPMAVVVLDKNATKVTPKEIERFIEERVQDECRLRGGVVFVDNIPLTPSSKINRYALKKMIRC